MSKYNFKKLKTTYVIISWSLKDLFKSGLRNQKAPKLIQRSINLKNLQTNFLHITIELYGVWGLSDSKQKSVTSSSRKIRWSFSGLGGQCPSMTLKEYGNLFALFLSFGLIKKKFFFILLKLWSIKIWNTKWVAKKGINQPETDLFWLLKSNVNTN